MPQRQIDEVRGKRGQDQGAKQPESEGRPESLVQQHKQIGGVDLSWCGLDVWDRSYLSDPLFGQYLLL